MDGSSDRKGKHEYIKVMTGATARLLEVLGFTLWTLDFCPKGNWEKKLKSHNLCTFQICRTTFYNFQFSPENFKLVLFSLCVFIKMLEVRQNGATAGHLNPELQEQVAGAQICWTVLD